MSRGTTDNDPQNMFSLLGTTYLKRDRGFHDVEMERRSDGYLTTDPYL